MGIVLSGDGGGGMVEVGGKNERTREEVERNVYYAYKKRRRGLLMEDKDNRKEG